MNILVPETPTARQFPIIAIIIVGHYSLAMFHNLIV